MNNSKRIMSFVKFGSASFKVITIKHSEWTNILMLCWQHLKFQLLIKWIARRNYFLFFSCYEQISLYWKVLVLTDMLTRGWPLFVFKQLEVDLFDIFYKILVFVKVLLFFTYGIYWLHYILSNLGLFIPAHIEVI